MVVKVTPAYPYHILLLLENIRPEDVKEMEALGLGVQEAVTKSLNNSVTAWTGWVDDQVVCMFGVGIGQDYNTGLPWMFGSTLVDRYEKIFLRRCKPYVDKMLIFFPMLVNFVDCRNVRAVKWLKWLGFTFDPECLPIGKNGEYFYRFWKKNESTCR